MPKPPTWLPWLGPLLAAAPSVPMSAETARSGLPALVVENQLYLFDTRLGLPIPGPGGTGVATLQQVREDDSLLRQLDLEDAPYPLQSSQLQEVVSLVVADAFDLSERAWLVEAKLTGEHRLALTSRPSEVAAKLDAMVETGALSRARAESEKAQPLRLKRGRWMLVMCASSWRSTAYMVESVRGAGDPPAARVGDMILGGLAILFGGMWLCLRSCLRGKIGTLIFGVLMLGIQAYIFFGPPPTSDRAAAWTALIRTLVSSATSYALGVAGCVHTTSAWSRVAGARSPGCGARSWPCWPGSVICWSPCRPWCSSITAACRGSRSARSVTSPESDSRMRKQTGFPGS